MYGWRYRGWGAYEDCDPRDTACVQRNTSTEVGGEQQGAIDATNAARDLCHSNANQSSEPFRSQLNAQCDANYPAGAATEGESIQFFNKYSTAPARADVFDTAAQSSAEYNAGQVAAAAQLRAELAKAGQTFIPDAARLPNTTVPAPVPSTIMPAAASSSIWNLNTSPASAPGSPAFALPASVSGLPWYVWAGGGLALVFAFKGGR